MHRCVYVWGFFVCASEFLSALFSSLFAWGYREAGRKQSGTGGVKEGAGVGGRKRRGKKGKGDRQIDRGPCRKKEELTVRETDKQAEIREKDFSSVHRNNMSDLSPLFVCMFILHLYPPPPNRFSYPLALSSLLLFCPLPPLPVFMLSLPSLAHLSSTLCLGAIAANQTVYPSLISALPHGAPAPSKQ